MEELEKTLGPPAPSCRISSPESHSSDPLFTHLGVISLCVWFTCSWKSCLNFSRMALLLLLSSPLDLSELKDSVHSKCNKIVPFKGRDINWEARDHEWTDPLNVFAFDVKDDIMCCGIVFLCPGWMLWLRQRRLTRSYWIIWDHDDAAQGSIAIVAGKNLLSLTLRSPLWNLLILHETSWIQACYVWNYCHLYL